MKYKNIIIKLRFPEIQLYISAVIHTALLNNVRKAGRLVLPRTSCYIIPCLRLDLPSRLFTSGFSTKILYVFFVSRACYMPCPSHPS
jgi:hypothetical protein